MCNDRVHYLSAAQVALLGEGIRLRILELLCRQEKSVSDLKEELGRDAPSNLYYHVDRLADAGLIELVRTEPRRGATEKYYRAVASRFSVAPELLGGGADVTPAVRGAFESVLARLAPALESDADLAPVVTQLNIRTSPERAERLRKSLEEWIAECMDADGKGDEEYVTLQVWIPPTG